MRMSARLRRQRLSRAADVSSRIGYLYRNKTFRDVPELPGHSASIASKRGVGAWSKSSSSERANSKLCMPGDPAIPEPTFLGPEALRPRLTTGLPLTGHTRYRIATRPSTVDTLRQPLRWRNCDFVHFFVRVCLPGSRLFRTRRRKTRQRLESDRGPRCDRIR